jgi:hypothetical protein
LTDACACAGAVDAVFVGSAVIGVVHGVAVISAGSERMGKSDETNDNGGSKKLHDDRRRQGREVETKTIG